MTSLAKPLSVAAVEVGVWIWLSSGEPFSELLLKSAFGQMNLSKKERDV